jgi:glycosyltransferase involved in cell wall biosynthesis
MRTVQEKPLVSVVTPSYNMAAFLAETIESVLSQDYPRIEYIVMDGGSTDGTLEILKRYGDRLRYVSTPDNGAAAAINRGSDAASGSVLAWLNADDTFLPGAVSAAVERLTAEPDAALVYGKAHWVDARGRILRPYPTVPFDPERLSRENYICQPAAFLRKSAFQKAGKLDPSLQSAFDYDLWIRLSRHGRFVHSEQYWATSRMHRNCKTLGNRSQMYAECFALFHRHFGYVPFRWVHSRCCFLLDGRDQFYEPLRPSLFKYLISLPYGCWHNRRRMPRFAREWWSAVKTVGFTRSLSSLAAHSERRDWPPERPVRAKTSAAGGPSRPE